MITGIQTDCTGFREFNSIAEQVVYNLLDTVHIAVKFDIGILEIVTEQDSLVIDHVGESENGTFQQVFKAELFLSRKVLATEIAEYHRNRNAVTA